MTLKLLISLTQPGDDGKESLKSINLDQIRTGNDLKQHLMKQYTDHFSPSLIKIKMEGWSVGSLDNHRYHYFSCKGLNCVELVRKEGSGSNENDYDYDLLYANPYPGAKITAANSIRSIALVQHAEASAENTIVPLTVSITIKKPDIKLNIFNAQSGTTFALQVDSNFSTVADVKEMIQKREGIAFRQISLTFVGKQLKDGRTLADYQIKDDCTLRLTL